MSTHDDFAANEQLAHAELSSVMNAIRRGNLDFTRPIHVPVYDKKQDVVPTSVRIPVYLLAALDELHGNGRKYRSRNQAVVQGLCLLLTFEAHTDDNPAIHIATIKAAQDNEDSEREMITGIADRCEKLLRSKPNAKALDRMLAQLEPIRAMCVEQDYAEELYRVERVIDNAHRYDLRRQVDDALDGDS